MKNLFSIDRTDDEFRVSIDDNPFVTARLSDEKLKEMTDIRLQVIGHDDSRPKVKASPLLWVGLALMVLAIVPVLIFRSSLFEGGRLWIAFADLLLLIASAVCIGAAGRAQRRDMAAAYSQETRLDFEEAMERMNQLTRASRKELNIPNRTVEVDVLPYLYRRAGEKKKDLSKKGHFDNIPVLIWKYGGMVCLSDCRSVLTIPETAFVGYNTYNEPFTVATWVKNVSCESAKYKAYGLRTFGMMSVRGQKYHGVVIRAESGDVYELRIPCYDLPELERLLGLRELSADQAM